MSEALRKSIPDSILPYPSAPVDRLKYFAWKIITPCHTFWRDLLIKLKILEHNFRQDHLLGTIAPDKKIEDLVAYLVDNGYANHFLAWRDTDAELISVRKLDGFERQYHLRVFDDGEVRGHYEFTPESHPVWHSKEVGWDAARETFLDFLRGWIVPTSSEPLVRED